MRAHFHLRGQGRAPTSVVVLLLQLVTAVIYGASPALAVSNPLDLGTLGGSISRATAVSGSIVVGESTTSSEHLHAFVYDVAGSPPVMVDLGTLGGSFSTATAVSGRIVVGQSLTAGDTSRRPFAYDLSAPAPAMMDLGALGGPIAAATAVSGTIVVGWSTTADGGRRAFAYDLEEPGGTMVDLGTLGGNDSRATAVSGSLVVGRSTTSNGSLHAFAYDLEGSPSAMIDLGPVVGTHGPTVSGALVASTSPTDGHPHAVVYDLSAPSLEKIDLGTLGGTFSFASAVSATIVVGQSATADGTTHAFAYDAGQPSPTMVDLGTLGGRFSYATAVGNSLVVGDSGTSAHPGEPHGFAYEIVSASPTMIPLGTLGGTSSNAVAVDGNLIAGTSRNAAGQERAVAWDFAAKRATTTTLTSSADPGVIGGTISYRATVRPVPDGGTVAFLDGDTTIATCESQPIDSFGEATCSVSYNGLGTHSISARYSGADDFEPSASEPFIQRVGFGLKILDDVPARSKAGSMLTIRVSLVDAAGGNRSSSNVLLTVAGVTPDPGTSQPTGTFTFVRALNRTGGYKFDLKTTGYRPSDYLLLVNATGDPVTHAIPFTLV